MRSLKEQKKSYKILASINKENVKKKKFNIKIAKNGNKQNII